MISRVASMSAWLGSVVPDGWLWAKAKAAPPLESTVRRTSRLSRRHLVSVPVVSCLSLSRLPRADKIRTSVCSRCGSSISLAATAATSRGHVIRLGMLGADAPALRPNSNAAIRALASRTRSWNNASDRIVPRTRALEVSRERRSCRERSRWRSNLDPHCGRPRPRARRRLALPHRVGRVARGADHAPGCPQLGRPSAAGRAGRRRARGCRRGAYVSWGGAHVCLGGPRPGPRARRLSPESSGAGVSLPALRSRSVFVRWHPQHLGSMFSIDAGSTRRLRGHGRPWGRSARRWGSCTPRRCPRRSSLVSRPRG